MRPEKGRKGRAVRQASRPIDLMSYWDTRGQEIKRMGLDGAGWFLLEESIGMQETILSVSVCSHTHMHVCRDCFTHHR